MKTTIKICFVLDCTESMGPWMQIAKDTIQSLIYDVREQHFGASFQVAFVGYRDYGSQERHVVIEFLDPEALVRAIRPIQPADGDDEAEDVAWGLLHASNLAWDHADVRLIYHIADAPAHGDIFTAQYVSDRFPEGDPAYLDPRMILKTWSQHGYHYTFVRINSTTDTMVEHFHNTYIGPGTFRTIDLSQRGPLGFRESVRDSIDQTLTRYSATQDPREGSGSPTQQSYSQD